MFVTSSICLSLNGLNLLTARTIRRPILPSRAAGLQDPCEVCDPIGTADLISVVQRHRECERFCLGSTVARRASPARATGFVCVSLAILRRREYARNRLKRCSTSHRKMTDSSGRKVRAVSVTSVSNTVCKSKVELLMTSSTSDVAVWCSSDSLRSLVRWRSSLSNRAFSMAMTAWAAKFCDKLNLLVGEGTHFLTVDGDDPISSSSLSIGTPSRANAAKFDRFNHSGIAFNVRWLLPDRRFEPLRLVLIASSSMPLRCWVEWYASSSFRNSAAHRALPRGEVCRRRRDRDCRIWHRKCERLLQHRRKHRLKVARRA